MSFSLISMAGCGKQNSSITLEQYEKVENAMTYSQVKKVLGKGTVKSEAGEKGSESYLIVYTWAGEKEDSSAVVVFQGDKVVSKSQVGLE